MKFEFNLPSGIRGDIENVEGPTDGWMDVCWSHLYTITVELRWLELVGTVGASSTHPCVRAIPSLTIFQVGSCVLYVITDTTFFYRPKLQSTRDAYH